MIGYGYAATVGFSLGSAIYGICSINQGRHASKLELGVRTDFPKKEGETTFAAFQVKAISKEDDLSAEKLQGAVANQFSLFADVTMKGGAYHLNLPKGESSFIMTTKEPQLFANAARLSANRSVRNRDVNLLSAISLGSGTRALQLWKENLEYLDDMRWHPELRSVIPLPRHRQMFACLGVCVVSAFAALRRLEKNKDLS